MNEASIHSMVVKNASYVSLGTQRSLPKIGIASQKEAIISDPWIYNKMQYANGS